MNRSFCFQLLCYPVIYAGACNAQIFSWEYDGYIHRTSGGRYYNIDNSGIDLTIAGLYPSSFYSIPATTDSGKYVCTGINNFKAEDIQHTYKFYFTEPVKVEFTIEDINQDTVKTCYRDRLAFSGNPVFTSPVYVDIIHDTIVMPHFLPYHRRGMITVTYEMEDTIIIKHGDGQGCNPGFIQINSLIINDNKIALGINETGPFAQVKSYIYDNRELVIEGLRAGMNAEVALYNLNGEKLLSGVCRSTTTRFDISRFSNGIYVLLLKSENGDVETRKIPIRR